MLTKDIKQAILKQSFSQGQKLPSIRKMAESLGVSTGSIRKVYKELEKEGFIQAVLGKGVFWGALPIEPKIASLKQQDILDSQFTKDLENGFLNEFTPLPSIKELSTRYGTSLYHIRKFINEKISQGILKKSGSKYLFHEEKKTNEENYILFVHRCDEKGHFIIETEREHEVFRTLTQFTQEQNIAIHFVGYIVSSNKLVTRGGVETHITEDSHCLGAFISTWLVKNPSLLFSHFYASNLPISVWWEYSAELLSKVKKDPNKWAYFNAAFGKNAGTIVGKFLREKKIREVNYISPFHNNEWSQKRLEGIQQEGVFANAMLNSDFDSPFDVMDKAVQLGQTPQQYLKTLLKGLLVSAKPLPFVCANDWVAATLIEMLESEGKALPYIIGFDNSTDSYRLCFDSFAFNVEAMVKEALYHIISPTKFAFFKKQVQNPPGKVVVKK